MTFADDPGNEEIQGIPFSTTYPQPRVLISMVIKEAGYGVVFSASSPYPTLPDYYKEAIDNNCDPASPGKAEMGYDPTTYTYVVTMHCKED